MFWKVGIGVLPGRGTYRNDFSGRLPLPVPVPRALCALRTRSPPGSFPLSLSPPLNDVLRYRLKRCGGLDYMPNTPRQTSRVGVINSASLECGRVSDVVAAAAEV